MNPNLVLFVVLGYFALLMLIARLTAKSDDNQQFFTAKKSSPWFVVAFGMIGASLSGVTFLSVPGAVGGGMFSYMQMVFGYLFGYVVIANVLLPLYYKLNLTSIYSYLEGRFGFFTYKTGASFFLLSRIIGASFRLFLVANVFHKFVLAEYGIPFWAAVVITVLLIWVYTFRGGIKTIVWTDTLQTLFMLLAVIITITFILTDLDWSIGEAIQNITSSEYSQIFVSDPAAGNYFWKHFLGGMFITIVMTGLDQDMMQKNLTCKNLGEAKKNVYSMSIALVPVNLLFLALGALLYLYGIDKGFLDWTTDPELIESGRVLALKGSDGIVGAFKMDELFPFLSFNYLPIAAGLSFIIGLTAAAYSSADSALTSLTTSFYIDILGRDPEGKSTKDRKLVHIGFSIVLILVILLFDALNNDSVINELFKLAGYTYGPLLGFYAFGLMTKLKVHDKAVPIIAMLAPLVTYILSSNSVEWFGYKFGFELLILNGILTFIGLWLSSLFKPKQNLQILDN
jgi:SSS family solute:Na+ symporter